MADFARWGAAAAEALEDGAEAFLEGYARNLGVQTREAVEGDVVGAAVMALMNGCPEWSGSPTALLTDLEDAGLRARLFRRNGNGKVDARGWPGGPHILSRRLRQVVSNLADLGITLEDRRGETRAITIRRLSSEGVPSSVDSVGSVEPALDEEIAPDATDAADAVFATSGGAMWETVIG